MILRSLLLLTIIVCFVIPAIAQNRYSAHRKTPADLSNFKNVLTFHGGVGSICGYAGVTGVLEYERFIDKEGTLSLTAAGGAYTSGTITLSEFDEGESRTEFVGGYFAPGLRVHPLGNGQKIDIAIGLSLPMGSSTRRDRYMDNARQILAGRDTRFVGIVAGQFVCNFRSTKHIVFGLSLSGGYFYANAQPTYATERKGTGYVVFGLRMGGLW